MNPRRAFIYFALLAAGLTATLVFLGPRALRYPDAMEYADMARGLARGDGLLDRAVWIYQLSFSGEVPAPAVRRAVLFPAAMALVFLVNGASDISAHATSALFFLLAVLATYQLALYARPGPRAHLVAFAAGTLALFDSPSILYAVSGLSEPMFAFIVVIMACLIVHDPFPGRWLFIGLLIGVAQWVRLNGFTLIVPALLAAFFTDRERFVRSAAFCIAGAAPLLIAIAIRNQQAVGMFSIVGINGAIMFNQLGGLTEHGIERQLYLPPKTAPSLAWIFQGHLAEFWTKFTNGLEKNFNAALMATSPLAWGAAALFAAAAWSRMTARVRALAAFTFSSGIIWIVLFATGEFEGSRFFVPLAPLVLTLAAIAFVELIPEDGLRRAPARVALAVLAAAMILPGVHRLAQLMGPDDTERGRLALGSVVQKQTPPSAVILTDIPWATAWYGDRASIWLPQRVVDTPRIAERAGATHLLLSNTGAANTEIEDRWKEIYYSRTGYPTDWKPLNTEPLSGSLLLFQLTRAESEN
jgi:hypothetical protein